MAFRSLRLSLGQKTSHSSAYFSALYFDFASGTGESWVGVTVETAVGETVGEQNDWHREKLAINA